MAFAGCKDLPEAAAADMLLGTAERRATMQRGAPHGADPRCCADRDNL
jgi:hypothetical protein